MPENYNFQLKIQNGHLNLWIIQLTNAESLELHSSIGQKISQDHTRQELKNNLKFELINN